MWKTSKYVAADYMLPEGEVMHLVAPDTTITCCGLDPSKEFIYWAFTWVLSDRTSVGDLAQCDTCLRGAGILTLAEVELE